MENLYSILWRGVEIGIFEARSSDMWYIDGLWKPHDTQEAKSFDKLVSSFNSQEVMKDPTKGTRVVCKIASTDTSFNALVISLENGNLFIKQIIDEKAIEWLIKNVY